MLSSFVCAYLSSFRGSRCRILSDLGFLQLRLRVLQLSLQGLGLSSSLFVFCHVRQCLLLGFFSGLPRLITFFERLLFESTCFAQEVTCLLVSVVSAPFELSQLLFKLCRLIQSLLLF